MCRIGRSGLKRFGVGGSDGADREKGVDRANEEEPRADFSGEEAPISYGVAPEIWGRLIERNDF